jgi:hypothetical protein
MAMSLIEPRDWVGYMVKAYGIALTAFKRENLTLHGHKTDLVPACKALSFQFESLSCRCMPRLPASTMVEPMVKGWWRVSGHTIAVKSGTGFASYQSAPSAQG